MIRTRPACRPEIRRQTGWIGKPLRSPFLTPFATNPKRLVIAYSPEYKFALCSLVESHRTKLVATEHRRPQSSSMTTCALRVFAASKTGFRSRPANVDTVHTAKINGTRARLWPKNLVWQMGILAHTDETRMSSLEPASGLSASSGLDRA